MKEAIEKAIEGGYEALPQRAEFKSVEIDNDHWFLNFYDLEGMQSDHFTFTIGGTLLDPEFWRCLGKAMGWGETEVYDRITGKPTLTMYWRLKQYDLIDHLANGGTADEFFEELLANHKENI